MLSLKTAGRSALLVSVVAAPLFVGCDTDSNAANNKIRADLEKSQMILAEGGPSAQSDARTLLTGAADKTEASDGDKAFAKSMLGNFNIQSGNDAMLKISRLELQVSALQTQIALLATQVGNSNTLVAGYAKFNPADTKTAIQQKIVEAQGGPDKPAWVTNDKSTIPTLSAANQEIAKLEGQISEKQEHIKQLTDKRTALLNDAEKVEQNSQTAKGQAAVDEFKKSADLRKQAADVQVEIDQTTAAVVPLQRDREIAQGQQHAVDQAIKQLQAQLEMLDKGWKDIQTQSEVQAQLAKSILASATPSDPDKMGVAGAISDKAAAMDKLLKQIAALRQNAQSDFDNAAKLFSDAKDAAEKNRRELQAKISATENVGRKELIVAWNQSIAVMHPAIFQLQQATAERMRGALLTSTAASADGRLRLSQMVTDAATPTGVALPEVLQPGALDQQRKDALAAAQEAFKSADALLENVTSGEASTKVPSIANAAYVDRVLTLYGWSQADSLGNNAEGAKLHLNQAVEQKKAAIDHNVPLPPLPSELGESTPAPVAPAAAPTSKPAV